MASTEEIATVTTAQPHLAKQDLSKLVSYMYHVKLACSNLSKQYFNANVNVEKGFLDLTWARHSVFFSATVCSLFIETVVSFPLLGC